MLEHIGEYTATVSDKFEKANSPIKNKYLKVNIKKFREIVGKIKFNRGSFGTGYPFYAVNPRLSKQLPIIAEQLRYNDELRKVEEEVGSRLWTCETCLRRNGESMPDLKQICRPCPKIDDRLKPRKIINRLPDLDMWLVCEDGKLQDSAELLEELLAKNGFKTSDINPVQTIYDMGEIVEALENGTLPRQLLPIDAHIVEYSELMKKINKIPDEIASGFMYDHIPYIPIHPLSLRKKWQKDDEAYNFVHDFLSSLTENNFDGDMQAALIAARRALASTYSADELYEILLTTGTESTVRRHQTKELRKNFDERINAWKK